MKPLLLLGRDHLAYGRLRVEGPRPDLAAAISVGADPLSPSMMAKGPCPNEDALLAWADDARATLAVADSHFGEEASHLLIERLAAGVGEADPASLLAGAVIEGAPDGSETTVTIACVDRGAGLVSGISLGDSTAAVLGPAGLRRLNRRTSRYLHPNAPTGLRRARTFVGAVAHGELLLLYTDGIDECHYRRPKTSITDAHMAALFAQVGPDPQAFVRRLGARALNGVDGNPGGQDNLVVVALAA